jgi:hypothetical protein
MNDNAYDFYDKRNLIRHEVLIAMHLPQGPIAWSSLDMGGRKGRDLPANCPRELDPRLR